MFKQFIVLLICQFLVSASFAQQDFVDIVYLKDGGVVRGMITKRGPNEQIAIQTVGENIFVFQQEEIMKLDRETLRNSNKKKAKKMGTSSGANNEVEDSRSGFINITEVGVLLGKSNNGEEAHLSFQTINGYQFLGYASIGLGLGVDFYEDSNIFPLFVDIRGNLLSDKLISPYCYGNVGYGFTSADNIENYTDTQRGGIVYGAGIGVQIKKSSNMSWVFSVGYKSQSTYASYEDTNGGLHERNLNLQRLLIKTGLVF